jgi:hypothetical protein
MAKTPEDMNQILGWFAEGRKLPRVPHGKTEESAKEIQMNRLSGQRPALAEEAGMDGLIQRARSATKRWKESKALLASTAVVIRLADIRTARGNLTATVMNRSVGMSTRSRLAAGIENEGGPESTAPRVPSAAAVSEEVLVASVETPQGIVEFILVGSEMRARVPGSVVERLTLGDHDIELAPISSGLYTLRGLSLRAFKQLLRKGPDV